jgi:hypothetical protein
VGNPMLSERKCRRWCSQTIYLSQTSWPWRGSQPYSADSFGKVVRALRKIIRKSH